MILFQLILTSLFFTTGAPPPSGALIINVDNIKKTGGIIWVGIYDSEQNFMIKENAIVAGFDVTELGKKELRFDTLAYGTYAIALFHDINGNGELDRNLIGIPSEPFAFSKRPKSKWRMPKFQEITFNFSQHQQVLDTRLKKWSAF